MADIQPIVEPVSGHLNNALQIAANFAYEYPQMSDEAVAAAALNDITAMRDRITAAMDLIEKIKESVSEENTQTYNAKSVAIARIRSWL